MGHDIYAYKRNEIAYYRSSAFNPDNKRIYLALDAIEDNYGGVSGLGTRESFNKEEIENARDVCEKNKWNYEAEFFKTILSSYPLNDNESIEIYFG